jgi:hypothetical protein
LPEQERAKTSAGHAAVDNKTSAGRAAVDAKLGEQNRGRATCEIANSKLLGEIGGQFRVNDLDCNDGEVNKRLGRSGRHRWAADSGAAHHGDGGRAEER